MCTQTVLSGGSLTSYIDDSVTFQIVSVQNIIRLDCWTVCKCRPTNECAITLGALIVHNIIYETANTEDNKWNLYWDVNESIRSIGTVRYKWKRHDEHGHSHRRRLHVCICIQTHTHYVHDIVRVCVPKRYILILFSCFSRLLFGAAAVFGSPRGVRARVAPRNRYTILQWSRYQRRSPPTLRGGSTVVAIRRFRFFLLLLLFFFYFFPTVSCRPPASASIEDRVFMHTDDLSPPHCRHLLLCSAQWKRVWEKKRTSNTLTDEAAERNIPARRVFAPCINSNITHSLT